MLLWLIVHIVWSVGIIVRILFLFFVLVIFHELLELLVLVRRLLAILLVLILLLLLLLSALADVDDELLVLLRDILLNDGESVLGGESLKDDSDLQSEVVLGLRRPLSER